MLQRCRTIQQVILAFNYLTESKYEPLLSLYDAVQTGVQTITTIMNTVISCISVKASFFLCNAGIRLH